MLVCRCSNPSQNSLLPLDVYDQHVFCIEYCSARNRRLETFEDALRLPGGVVSSVASSTLQELAILTAVFYDSRSSNASGSAAVKYVNGNLAEVSMTREILAEL